MLKLCNFTEKRIWHMSLLNLVPCMPLCQRGLCANVLVCQHGLHANMPKACQLLIFTCQHANKRANVPYGMPMF